MIAKAKDVVVPARPTYPGETTKAQSHGHAPIPTYRPSEAPPVPEQLGRMITGCWVSEAIYTAAKLGIADLLKDGPKKLGCVSCML